MTDSEAKLWAKVTSLQGKLEISEKRIAKLIEERDGLKRRVAEMERELTATRSAARLCAGADLDAQEQREKAERDLAGEKTAHKATFQEAVRQDNRANVAEAALALAREEIRRLKAAEM